MGGKSGEGNLVKRFIVDPEIHNNLFLTHSNFFKDLAAKNYFH